MLKPLVFILVLLSLCACGQKKAATQTQFVISGLAAAPTDTVNGSLMVSAFNPETKQFLRVKMGASSQTLTLPNGTWFFSGVYWNDTNTEGAVVRCALAQAELKGEEVAIDLSLSVNACKEAVFTQPVFLDEGELQAIQVNQCDSFGAPSTSCASNPGVVESFKIVFMPYTLSTLEKPSFDSSGSISSACIDTGLNGVVNSATLIPSGSTNVPIPFVIRTFSGEDCNATDFVTQFNFTHGLLTGDTGSTRVHDFNSTTDVTRLLIKDGSIGPLHATVAIPAEANYRFDLRKFVSGGTLPYSFVSSSPGNLDGVYFTGSGAADVYTITATDADDVTTTFTLNTVVKSHHTVFSDLTVGGWTVNRSSSNYSMNSIGVLTEVAPGAARFVNTGAIGAVLADKYLVNEKPTSNLLTAPVDFTNGSAWTRANIVTPTPLSGGISLSHPHFLLDKTTGGVSTLTQTLPPRNGNHVGSIYLKRGSSRFAGLRLENPTHPTNPCTGIVIDLDTGDTTAMGGCPFVAGTGLNGSQYIGNGWWRVWVTRIFQSNYPGSFIVFPAWGPAGGIMSPVENTSATGTILAFNPQLEGGNRPTTANSYSTARSNETVENTANIGDFSLTSGTYLLDWHALEPTQPNKRLLSLCNASTRVMEIGITNNRVRVTGQFSNTAPLYPWGVQAANQQDVSASSQNRIAFKVGGSIRLFNRGESAPVTVAGNFPATTFTRLLIGGDCDTGQIHNVGIRRFGFWAVQFEDVVLKEMANDSNVP
jgi:hypothetical protein